MPSSQTITTFYNFTANTRARASEVNYNFDIFRGHIIPVDPNTATSANETYDMGASSHRWLNLYGKNLNLTGSTTTGELIIRGDTTVTTGVFKFDVGSTTVAKINSLGFDPAFIAGLFNVQTFTASGTWTCPAGVVRAFVMGCGGGGGGGGGGGDACGGGGGGSGSQAFLYPITVTPGVGYSITVGAGGAYGAGAASTPLTGGTSGLSGGSSSFSSLLTFPGAPGGNGGDATAASSSSFSGFSYGVLFTFGGGGSAPGTASTANSGERTPYYAGGSFYTSAEAGAGGGGGASSFASGGIGGTAGDAGNSGGDGTNGTYGSGGGGGGGNGTGGGAGGGGHGGTGGNGVIVVYWQ